MFDMHNRKTPTELKSDRTRNKIFLLALLAALCITFLPSLSYAQQGTLTDDAVYPLQTNTPTNNRGNTQTPSTQNLQVQGPTANGGSATTYIKFKLTGTSTNMGDLPSGTPGSYVRKATLKLFLNNVTTAGSVDVYRVTNPWTELDTTAPTYDPAPVATGVPVTKAGSFTTHDITPLVKQWLDYDANNPTAGGLPNYGIAIVASATSPNTAVEFDSKESTQTSHQAQLTVVLNHATKADHATDADHAKAADSATSVTGTVNASQVSGALTNATIAGDKITGNLNITGSGSVSGSLSAGTVAATTQFNIGNSRVLGMVGPFNFFAGPGAGASNPTGGGNAFFGVNAGSSTSSGRDNAFFGSSAGNRNTTGSFNTFSGAGSGGSNSTGGYNTFTGASAGAGTTEGGANSFFGYRAGVSNTTGNNNSVFGADAGYNLNSGSGNSIFGYRAGEVTSTGNSNAFFGNFAGSANTTGGANTFIGTRAGQSNTVENNNTFIGASSNGAAGITNATALGANAKVTQSNSLVLGNNANVGIGTSAPHAKLDVEGDVRISGNLNVSGTTNATISHAVTADTANALASTATVSGSQVTGALSDATIDGSKVTGTLAAPLSVSAGSSSPLVSGNNTGDGPGVSGTSVNHFGVYGASTNGTGVYGRSDAPVGNFKPGVLGASKNHAGVHGIGEGEPGQFSPGVFGRSFNHAGVWGHGQGAAGTFSPGVQGYSDNSIGVHGEGKGPAGSFSPGVHGFSDNSFGVHGVSKNHTGVYGRTEAPEGVFMPGILGVSKNSAGVHGVGEGAAGQWSPGVSGYSANSPGVYGHGEGPAGVQGNSTKGIGVLGIGQGGPSQYSPGVLGKGENYPGVVGQGVGGNGTFSPGVHGQSTNNAGVFGESNGPAGAGIHGKNTAGGLAGQFDGSVVINGNLNVTGSSNIGALRVVDSAGKDVGQYEGSFYHIELNNINPRLVPAPWLDTVIRFDSTSNSWYRLLFHGGGFYENEQLWYTTLDCSGPAYMRGGLIPLGVVQKSSDRLFIPYGEQSTRYIQAGKSLTGPYQDQCAILTNPGNFEVKEVKVVPLSSIGVTPPFRLLR